MNASVFLTHSDTLSYFQVRREFRAFRELLEAERAESAGDWKAKFQLRKNQERKLRDFEQTTKWTVLTSKILKN